MNSEIFRFSIVRNPKRISSEKYQISVVQVISDDLRYPFYNGLKQESNREAYLAAAVRFLHHNDFVTSLTQLNLPFWEMSEWLYSQEKLNGDQIKAKIEELFGMDIADLVEHENFKNDKIKVSDSLVVAAMVKPKQIGLRGDLMRTRRLIFLLEHLAKRNEGSFDAKSIRRILSATVMLPGDLFPIPNENAKRIEENKKAYEKRKESIEKELDHINQITEKLAKNEGTIHELTQAYSKHLFELRYSNEEDIGSDDPGATPAVINKTPGRFISLLPADKYNKLSNNTKKIIRDGLKISKDHVDIPFIVSKLEDENTGIARVLGQIELPDDLNFPSKLSKIEHIGPCTTIKIVESKTTNNFSPDTRGEVNVHGMQDLLIVRQELLKYEPGEIAHIENILKGEFKNKKHRKLDRSEVIVFEETEKTEETEEELQTTDRYELQSEASRTLSETYSGDAGVKYSGSYGWGEIEAHGNAAYNRATEESSKSASTIAKDTVSRSVQKIKERVLKRRSKTDISEIEIINEHGFDNKQGDDITGIYRWVDKYYKAEIVNYGKRIMLEFMIPEPAAFYRFALANKPKGENNLQKPDEPGFCKRGIFYKLKPTDLSPANYIGFVAKYEVRDITPPPQNYINVSKNIRATHDETENNTSMIQFAEQIIKAPEKYRIIGVSYRIHVGMSHVRNTSGQDEMHVSVLLGEKHLFEKDMREYKLNDKSVNVKNSYIEEYVFLEPEKSDNPAKIEVYSKSENIQELALSVSGFSTLALSINIGLKIQCERTEQAYEQWQIDTFNAIMTAYQVKRMEYEEAMRAQEFNASINIQGRNPLLNREIEKTELKKHAISILTGQQYESFNAMEEDHTLGYPQIDLEDAKQEGKFVRFFEQALEWRHTTYMFYPYFWGNKKNWVETLNLKDTDPLFEKFLQAGYARVWVPLRPGFESVVGYYIECSDGEPWTDKDAPLCDHPEHQDGYDAPPFVSLLDEIKEQLDNDFVQRGGTISVTNGSKNVTGTDTDFSVDDVDRELLVNLEVYRIAAFVSATEIELREPYRGEDAEGMGYAIGVKYVGEPWVVKVPTSLVWLEEKKGLF